MIKVEGENVVGKLSTTNDSKAVTDASIKKHEVTIAELNANFESQTKLLAAIVDINAQFASIRKAQLDLLEKQRQGMIESNPFWNRVQPCLFSHCSAE